MMKKLFTSLLLLGVALCSWAQAPSLSTDGTVLTVPKSEGLLNAGGPAEIKTWILNQLNLTAFPSTMTTLKLDASYTNEDFVTEPTIAEKVINAVTEGEGAGNHTTIYLDLSTCSNLISKVKYTGEEYAGSQDKIDWASKNFEYLPDPNEEITNTIRYRVTKTVTPYSNTTVTASLYSNNDVGEIVPEFLANLALGVNADLDATYPYSPDANSSGTIEYHEKDEEVEFPIDYDPWKLVWKVEASGWYWIPSGGSNGYYNHPKINTSVITDNGETVSYTYVKDGETIEVSENDLDKVEGGDELFTETIDDVVYYRYTESTSYKQKRFAFGDPLKERLNGISFPNGDNFTAIPDGLCKNFKNLTKVEFGNKLEWIGKNAFKMDIEFENKVPKANQPLSQLSQIGTVANQVNFPSTLKVIGLDAFYGCVAFKSVNLNLSNLVKVDAAAFNMVWDDLNSLQTVTLPTSRNESLRFWGNQVFSSSHIQTLDFSNCYGIYHFAYDGKNSMNEGTWENPDGSGVSAVQTFYWHQSLETLSLPPNLEYISHGDENMTIAGACDALTTLIFNGVAQFDSDSNPTEVTNEFVVGDGAFQSLTSLQTVIFVENSNLSEIGEDAFKNCSGIQTVTLGGIAKFDANCNVINPVEIQKMAFFKNTSLENLTLSDNVTFIGEAAFDQTSSLEVVHIPASVLTIKYKAFNECPSLTKIYFDDTTCPNCDNVENMPTMTIEGYVFMNAQSVLDVYVNNRTPINCQNSAFARDITFGQSNVEANMATLHYPKGQEEHYTNLNHYLTDAIANDAGKFQAWLVDHFAAAQDPANGWHEFVNSGPSTTGPDPGPQFPDGVILRTFSEVNYACLVPDGIKAFVVNGVKKTSDGKSYELSLYPIRVIPAKTGVILYGQPNARDSYGNPTLSMTPVRFAPIGVTVDGVQITTEQGKPYRRENWTALDNDPEHKKTDPFSEAKMTEREMLKNYLMPTSDDAGNPLDLGPTEKDATGKVIFRNFAMQRYSNTKNLSGKYELTDIGHDFVGFFRCLKNPNKWPAGYAYLRLSAVEDEDNDQEIEIAESTSAEIIVNMFNKYWMEFDKTQQTAKLIDGTEAGYWTAAVWNEPLPNWGNRSTAFSGEQPHFIFTGEMDGETEGVVTLTIPVDESNQGDYYTLQGVKVNKPTKGVYILNGKKVVIK